MTTTSASRGDVSHQTAKGEVGGVPAAFLSWLVLPRGYTNWLWRLLGICGLVDGLQVHNWMAYSAVPYIVPAWRFGSNLLNLPVLPHSLIDPLFTLYFSACAAMALGLRSKLVLLVPIATLSYFCCLDLMVGSLHFTILLCCFFISLLFDRPGLSLTRRLIQLCIAFCYGYSVLQKLSVPLFREGYSLAAHASDGWFMKPYWFDAARNAHPSHEFYVGLSAAVILTEAFLCVALFPRVTRSLGVLVGIIFHGIMATLMHWWIGVFTLVTWSSYFAFLEPKEQQPTMSPALGSPESTAARREFILKHRTSVCAAVALLLLWFCVPLRIYFWNDRPTDTITILDRRPWTFAMFVTAEVPNGISASYTDEFGQRHHVEPVGRMVRAKSDNELYALANYIFRTYPNARTVNVQTDMSIDEIYCLRKILYGVRSGKSITFSPMQTLKYDYKKDVAASGNHGGA